MKEAKKRSIEICLNCPYEDCIDCIEKGTVRGVMGRPSRYSYSRVDELFKSRLSGEDIAVSEKVAVRTAYRWIAKYKKERTKINAQRLR